MNGKITHNITLPRWGSLIRHANQVGALALLCLLAACMTQRPAKVRFHGVDVTQSGLDKQAVRDAARRITATPVSKPLLPLTVRDYGDARPRTKTTESANTTKSITVRKGDTLYQIANRYSVTTRGLIEANNLKPPYGLIAGQKLTLPQRNFVRVRAGETLYSIAEDNHVEMSQMAKLNGLKAPYALMVGQRLQIPNRYASAVTSSPGPTPATSASRSQSNIIASYDKRSAAPSPKAKPKQPSRAPAARNVAQKPANLGTFSGKFKWPVKGRIITPFGTKRGGVYHEGINIAAKAGTRVHAAAKGEVVYIGSGLKGYGNLVILRHAGGWLTAYAHLAKIGVQKGQVINTGGIIGSVGETGNVTSPQLHFAVRKGRTSKNPVDYLS